VTGTVHRVLFSHWHCSSTLFILGHYSVTLSYSQREKSTNLYIGIYYPNFFLGNTPNRLVQWQ
jgi:hypothetical protein